MNYLIKVRKKEVFLQPTVCNCEFCHSPHLCLRFIVDNGNLLSFEEAALKQKHQTSKGAGHTGQHLEGSEPTAD